MSVSQRVFAGVFLGIGVLSTLVLSAPVTGESYALVDLTAVTGELSGTANDVNDAHIVVGRGGYTGYCAVRWQRSGQQWHEVIFPPGNCAATLANAVNNPLTTVGAYSKVNSPNFPIIWEDDDFQIVFLQFAWFADINDSGQIVGRGSDFGAFVWEEGEVTSLGGSWANGINAQGQVVGRAAVRPGVGNAALWEVIVGQWIPTILGTLGGTSSEASDINGSTQVVGWAETPGDLQHAFVWEEGLMTDPTTTP